MASVVRILLVALAGISLAACGKSDPPTTAPPPNALTEIRLGYFANVTHAQAVLGVSSGEFQAALGSVKLKTKVFNAGPELIQSLNAGAIDVGYVGPGPAISAYVNSSGQALRVLAGSAANGVAIVARKDAGISSLADLKGKKIATPQLGNTQDVSARHYVTAILGEPDSDNVVEVPNSQQSGLMARGRIDAAWVPEPWASRLIVETGAVLIGEEKDLWPGKQFSLTVVITTPQFLAAYPDVIKELLDVHHRWTQRLSADPLSYAGQLNDALASLSGKKLPADILAGALARTQFTDDPLPETFKTMSQWSYGLHFIKTPPDLTGLFETGMIAK